MASSSAEAVRRFFSNPYFAVAGASQDANKFGYKILAWYHAHNLTVTPLNPRTATITLSPSNQSLQTLPSPSALPHPTQTSLSIVTPPAVTRTLLKEAHTAGVKAVWLQPGTYDDEILESIKSEFEVGVGGEAPIVEEGEGSEKRVWRSNGGEGWCVLVDGDDGLRAAAAAAKKEAESKI